MTFSVNRRRFVAGAGALATAGCLRPVSTSANDPLLFAYFTGGKGQTAGLRFAGSDDGFTFRALGGGRSYLIPEVGEAQLMRDPFLFRGPDGAWHLLWTTAWEGVTIGHATSRDLIRWSDQRAIPVMAGVPGTRNCWAPEAHVDARSGVVTLFWSSTVAGRFTGTAGSSETGYNHRLWRATTRDFKTVFAPEPMYDPGFSVIDGTLATAPGGELWLIVKDETVTPPRKWLRAARAPGPAGPFGALSPPFTGSWVEGPMTAQVGDALVCYYDVYREGRWGAAMTRDMVRWDDVSDRLTMPPAARHGSLVRVPRDRIAALDASS